MIIKISWFDGGSRINYITNCYEWVVIDVKLKLVLGYIFLEGKTCYCVTVTQS